MAKKRVLVVPHGKQGLTLENVAFNLDSVSAIVSAFTAVMVKKDPDLKDEMMAVLRAMLSTGGLSDKSRDAIADALSSIEELITDEKFLQ